VPVSKGFDFRDSTQVQARLAEAEQGLDGVGRVLLRASGTEPVLRVMVEGKSGKDVRHWAEAIADTVRQAAD
jgi:phosphoglucosamine mutase